jgi:hypothetical protein
MPLVLATLMLTGCGRGGGEGPAGAERPDAQGSSSPAVAKGVYASPVFARVPADALFAGALRPADVRGLFGSALDAVDRAFSARWGVGLVPGSSWEEAGLDPGGVVLVALREGPRREVSLFAELAAGEGGARAVVWVDRLAGRASPPRVLRWEKDGEAVRASLGDGLSVRVGGGVVEIAPEGWRPAGGGLAAETGFVRAVSGLEAPSAGFWARSGFLPWSVPFVRGAGLGGPLALGVAVDADGVGVWGRAVLASGAVGRTSLAGTGVVEAFEALGHGHRLGVLSVGMAPGGLEAVLAESLGQEAGRAAVEAAERLFGAAPAAVLGGDFGGALAVALRLGIDGAEVDSVGVGGLDEAAATGVVARLGEAGTGAWRFEWAGGALRGRRGVAGDPTRGAAGPARTSEDWPALARAAGAGLVALGVASAEGVSLALGLEAQVFSAAVAVRTATDALEVLGRLRPVREGALGLVWPPGAFDVMEASP